jgi:hypothetical protein
MSIHPSVGKVYRVRHIMTTATQNAHANSDLIYVNGVPTIVVEWEVRPDGDRPRLTFCYRFTIQRRPSPSRLQNR